LNVSYLESNKESLINHMKAAGYSVSYIKKCRSIETVLDELPARSFSIRNMAGFPYHIIFPLHGRVITLPTRKKSSRRSSIIA